MSDVATVWTVIGLILLAWYLVHCWRFPYRACRRCQAKGRVMSTATGQLTSGFCRRCKGTSWYPRRVSRWMGRA